MGTSIPAEWEGFPCQMGSAHCLAVVASVGVADQNLMAAFYFQHTDTVT